MTVFSLEHEKNRQREQAKRDPLASPLAMLLLLPLEQLAHPNCPTEMWWALAKSYPVEAMDSPLYPLLTLETPERWLAMQEKHGESWMTTYLRHLSPAQQQWMAAACIEHVLPWFVGAPGHDIYRQMRTAMERRRAFARGELSEEEWEEIRAREHLAAKAPYWDEGYKAAYEKDVDGVARMTIFAIAKMAEYRCQRAQKKADVWDQTWVAARQWQWARLLQYLRGEV